MKILLIPFIIAFVLVVIILILCRPRKINGETAVYITEGGKTFHASRKCSALKGRSCQVVPLSEALKKGYKPCGHCIKKR